MSECSKCRYRFASNRRVRKHLPCIHVWKLQIHTFPSLSSTSSTHPPIVESPLHYLWCMQILIMNLIWKLLQKIFYTTIAMKIKKSLICFTHQPIVKPFLYYLECMSISIINLIFIRYFIQPSQWKSRSLLWSVSPRMHVNIDHESDTEISS